MIDRVMSSLPRAKLLIVDDHSPDGTADVVRRLQTEREDGRQLILEERPGKLGIGSAHRLAMMMAIHEDYDYLITMDGDGSHDPVYLPEISKELEHHDFVIGSRFLPDSKLDYEGWRRVVSVNANRFLALLIQPGATEFTTALRGFRVNWLKTFPLHHMPGQGYSFFFRCVVWIHKFDAKVKEIPIHFMERDAGQSKVNFRELFLGVTNVFRIILSHWLGKKLPVSPAPTSECPHCKKNFRTLEVSRQVCLACGNES